MHACIPRRRSRLIVAVALFAGLVGPASVLGQAALVSEVSGRVEIRLPGRDWQAAVPGASLPAGSSISTGFDGSALLELEGAVIRVRRLTRMSLEELARRGDAVGTTLNLQVGRVRAEVKRVADAPADFRIRGPVSTAAVRGTEFEFDGLSIEVISGAVGLSNDIGQSRTFHEGERGRAAVDGALTSPEDALEEDAVVVPYLAAGDDDEPEGLVAAPGGLPTGSLRIELTVTGM